MTALIRLVPLAYALVLLPRDKVYIGIYGDSLGWNGVVQGIIQGNYFPLRDPFIAENSGTPHFYTPLAFWVAAEISLLSGCPVWETDFWFSGMCVPLFSLLAVYTLLRRATRDPRTVVWTLFFVAFAAGLGWLVLLGTLLKYPSTIVTILSELAKGAVRYDIPLEAKREITDTIYSSWDLGRHAAPISQGLSGYQGLGLAFAMVAVYLTLRSENKHGYKMAILGGVFLGLLVLTHTLVSLAYIIAVLAYLTISFVLRRGTPDLIRVQAVVMSVGATLSAFYWLPIATSLLTRTGAAYYAWSMTSGIEAFGSYLYPGRVKAPLLWEYLAAFGLPLILGIIGLYQQRRAIVEESLTRFLFSWLLTMFTLANIHYIGFVYQPFRFAQYLSLPLCYFAGAVTPTALLPRAPRAWSKTMLVLTVLVATTASQSVAYAFNLTWIPEQMYIDRGYYDAFTWLRQNTNPSDVILASHETSNYIPAVSGNKAAMGWVSTFAILSSEQRQDRLRDLSLILGPSDTTATQSLLEKYHADYILIGPNEREISNPLKLSTLERLYPVVYQGSDVTILRVQPR